MGDYKKSIRDHYGRTGLLKRITSSLEQAGISLENLTREDIAPFDEFHIRGREATREMAQLSGLKAGMEVLDIGSGLGGPARTLAAEFECDVAGVDLVDEYCRTAAMLTEWVGLADRVHFQLGDIVSLPFMDDTFDVVWSQHSMMNLEDKQELLDEVHRVLRSDGYFVLYEICSGTEAPPRFPVPWATDPHISFLVTPEDMRHMLIEAGFQEMVWRDVSTLSLNWFRNRLSSMEKRAASDAQLPPGMDLLMGETTPEKFSNVVENLKEDRIRVVQGILNKMRKVNW